MRQLILASILLLGHCVGLGAANVLRGVGQMSHFALIEESLSTAAMPYVEAKPKNDFNNQMKRPVIQDFEEKFLYKDKEDPMGKKKLWDNDSGAFSPNDAPVFKLRGALATDMPGPDGGPFGATEFTDPRSNPVETLGVPWKETLQVKTWPGPAAGYMNRVDMAPPWGPGTKVGPVDVGAFSAPKYMGKYPGEFNPEPKPRENIEDWNPTEQQFQLKSAEHPDKGETYSNLREMTQQSGIPTMAPPEEGTQLGGYGGTSMGLNTPL